METQNKEKNLPNLDIQPKEPPKNKKSKIIKWSIFGIVIILIGVLLGVTLGLNRADILQKIFYDGIFVNFIALPSLLIGSITLIGYIALRKKWYDCLTGTVKAVIGYLILQCGSFILTGISKPLMIAIGSVIGSNAVVLDPYMGYTQAEAMLKVADAASMIALVVLLGLATNIILISLKKITNVHSLNVTGHIMFQQAAIFCAVLYFIVFRNISDSNSRYLATLICSGVLVGLYWGVFSNLTIRPTNDVTNGANFAIGHQQMLICWSSYQAGKLFNLKKKEIKSAETMELKGGFKVFHDSIFMSSLLMLVFFGALFTIVAATDHHAFNIMLSSIGGLSLAGNVSWGIQIVIMSLSIVAALQILMLGARMFVAELQKSFIGISTKLIPNAIIAIDIAGVFSFSEKSVVFGFLAGAIGNFVAIAIIILVGQVAGVHAFSTVIMVGFIPMFFDNGASGVYANKTGGIWACLTIPFIMGIISTMFALLAVQSMSDAGTTFVGGFNGLFDMNVLWGLTWAILSWTGPATAPYLLIIMVVLLLVIAQLTTTGLEKDMGIKRLITKKIKNKTENQVEVNR